MKTFTKAIIIMFFCTLFTSLGQLLWKFSAPFFALSIFGIFFNKFLVLGFLSYILGSGLLILALRKEDLSSVYPLLSLSFIWVMLLSIVFLGETLSLIDWIGVGSIISGIIFITWGVK